MSIPKTSPDRVAKRHNKRFLLLIVALFFGPIVIAWVLNIKVPTWLPFGTTNNGTLVQPTPTLIVNGLQSMNEESFAFDHRWTILVVTDKQCQQVCQDALYATRQARLGLGRDYQRLRRILVTTAKALPQDPAIVAAHPDLALFYAIEVWWQQLPFTAIEGGVYLIDPQKNVLLYYMPPVTAPELIDDLTRLLKISKIG